MVKIKQSETLTEALLMPRDIKLFKYLYEVKVASFEQVSRMIFNNVHRTTVYRRLKKLILANYIQVVSYTKGIKATRAYSLTSKSFKTFISGELDKETRKQIKSHSIQHDLILGDIRERLLKSERVAQFISENVLLSGVDFPTEHNPRPFLINRPDGIIEVKKIRNNYLLPVEFELTQKSSARYAEKFQRYYTTREIEVVIYVVSNKQLLNKLKDIEKKYIKGQFSKMYYILLENVLSSQETITFERLKGHSLSL